jgi:hypothetical protein
MPPFGNDGVPPSRAANDAKPPAGESAKVNESMGEPKLSRVPKTRGDAGGPEIPTYDLAENILAPHRRSAAKRRKSPGQVQPEPQAPVARVDVATQVLEPPSQDPLEIRRLVAEIVARDIERLCRKPSKPLCAL